MGPQMHVVSPVLVVQDLSITRHEHRDRIRQKQHSRGDSARVAIHPFVSNARILQFYCIHQMMQSYVCVTATQSRKQRSHESAKSYEGVTAKCTEEEIEPDDIRLQTLQRRDEAKHARWMVE